MSFADKIRAVNQTSGVKKSHVLGNLRIFLNRNLWSHSAPHKCLLTISKCLLSVLWRCRSYREFGCSKMTEKWPRPAPGVPLIEVSVKRELTVHLWQDSLHVYVSMHVSINSVCCVKQVHVY